MPKFVIAGAGPAGLHLALLLTKNGIAPQEILIVDPRAGHYTRPGSLNQSVFQRVFDSLEMTPKEPLQFAHIKKLERELYAEVLHQGIRVLKEKFINLNPADAIEGSPTRITISAGQQNTRVIPCQYLFDCTGSKRDVTNAVNAHYQKLNLRPPFHTTAISNVTIKHHFLAYVKVKDNDLSWLKNINAYRSAPTADVPSILRLRKFGWVHCKLPMLYADNFGKNKVCFYVELPENCPEEQHLNWLKTVLSCMTKKDNIHISLLPKSRKWENKPRIQAFKVNPESLNIVGYNAPNLPIIMATGDAVDEADYREGNGVTHAVDCNEAIIRSLAISNGKISAVDPITAYRDNTQELREKHQSELTELYRYIDRILLKSLQTLHDFISTSIASYMIRDTWNANSKRFLDQALFLINDAKHQITAITTLSQFNDLFNQEIVTLAPIEPIENNTILITIHQNLLFTHKHLSKLAPKKLFVQTALETLFQIWDDYGDNCTALGQLSNANKAYQYALDIIHALNQAPLNPLHATVLASLTNDINIKVDQNQKALRPQVKKELSQHSLLRKENTNLKHREEAVVQSVFKYF